MNGKLKRNRVSHDILKNAFKRKTKTFLSPFPFQSKFFKPFSNSREESQWAAR